MGHITRIPAPRPRMERFLNPNPDRARRSQTAVPEQLVELATAVNDAATPIVEMPASDAADEGDDVAKLIM